MQIVTCSKCGAKNRVDEEKLAKAQPVCGRCGTPLAVGAGGGDGRPVEVTDASFGADVLQRRGGPVLVDCWAAWCGPCRMIAPVVEQLAAESAGRYTVAKLNVDENPRTAAQFNISSIPTLLIFKNGQLVDQLVGVRGKGEIEAHLEEARGV